MGRSGRRTLLSTVALGTLALAAAPLRAGTLHVPGDSPTIQGAIDLAANGDTILVAPGTYAENLSIVGSLINKEVIIESTGGAETTIIDGGGRTSTVTAISCDAALRGFTITGGTGQPVTIPGFGGGTQIVQGGGGVLIAHTATHLELTDCIITGNSVTDQYAHGGGVFLSGGTLVMSGCTISGNTAEDGAAIAMFGYPHTLTATDCTLTGNTVTGSGRGALFSWDGTGSFSNCQITDNAGDGIFLTGYGTHFSRCVVSGNSGWGLRAYADFGPDVIGFAFLGNGLGGARCTEGKFFGSEDVVSGCVFAGGDGLDISHNDFATLSNCTFDDTTITATGNQVTVKNSIGRGTTAVVGAASLAVTYSDVVGFGVGTGNIDTDPLWVDAGNGDYALLPASPCIDAGDPSSPLDPDGTRADMGAIPFENAFDDLGGGVAGSAGPVLLASHSTLLGGEGVYFKLTGTPPTQPVVLILGASQLGAPFKGGTLWPNPSVLINLATNGAGQLTLNTTWPAAIPSGFKLWAQYWYPDAGAVAGFAGSNGVRGTVP